MGNMSMEQLAEKAMQIILHAGDGRKQLQLAINTMLNDGDDGAIQATLDEAKTEITKAHNIQTAVIQEHIEDDGQINSILFIHAQDTLMTINSEMLLVRNMVAMYRKLTEKLNCE